MKKTSLFPLICIALLVWSLYSCNNPAVPAVTPKLEAAQNVNIVIGSLKLDLSWDAVPNATGYTVYYTTDGTDPTQSTTTSLSATTTNLSHTGLSDQLTYKYIVAAAAAGFETSISATAMARPNNAFVFSITASGYANLPMVVLPLYANAAADWASSSTYYNGTPVSGTTDGSGFVKITVPVDRTHYWGYTVFKDLDNSGTMTTGDEVWGSGTAGSFNFSYYSALATSTYNLTFNPWNARSTATNSHIY